MSEACQTIRLLGLRALPLILGWVFTATAWAVPPTDTMEQRVRPCAACHSETGVELESGYVPRLYGKPAGYLFNQLVNYREGRRHNRAMAIMVSHLSDAYLWEIARYFAARDVPYPDPAPPSADAELRARGLELVTRGDVEQGIPACQACHGERLTGVQPNTPGLLGLPHYYLMAQLGAWRAGTRHAAAPDCMRRIAERLNVRDIQAVAAWLAAQPVPSNPEPAMEPIADPPLACGSVPLPGH